MDARLYVIPGSHPSAAVAGMLDRKGIPYKRRDLMPMVSRPILRSLRFPGSSVPSLAIEGRKITGSREISRALDEIRPEPPLFPSDPSRRTEVEAAERWGDEDLQEMARRISWWALRKDRGPLRSFSEGAKLGIPTGLAVKTAAPIVALDAWVNKATDENVRRDLAALPGALRRIDSWIADGVLGGSEPNAADFQIAASLRLLLAFDDLKPFIESRPAGELARRLVPDFPGHAPPVLPESWLAPLRESA